MLARRLQDKDTANSHGIKGLGLNSEMTFFLLKFWHFTHFALLSALQV